MGSRAAKDALYDRLAAVAKAMGSGRRAELIDVLAQGERSVEELARELGQSTANTSQHLRLLLHAGLVRTRRDGTRVYYALAGTDVGRLLAAVRDVAEEHDAEIGRLAADYLGDRTSLEEMTREQLAARLGDGDLVVLDVRPPPEYAAAHIPGAVSLPVDVLARRLREVPRDKDVVAYCRGPYCVYADDAVRLLRRRGYRAARLEDGLPEWVADGRPVTVPASEPEA